MNDSEYAAKWRILAAQLHELERAAGIGDALSSLRDAMPSTADPAHADKDDGSGGEHSARPYRLPLDALQQRELRALYFGVSHLPLRKSLIAKQRELDLFERTGARTALVTTAGFEDVVEIGRQARPELYNLETDIGESTNVYNAHPDIVKKLEGYLAQMDKDLGQSKFGPGCRPAGKVENPRPMIEK